MTYEQIAAQYPEEALARKRDKLNYRYPQGGESYMDVIARIEPCILELERMSTPVLLVVHRAVARCLYSYFVDIPAFDIPHLDIPLHTVLKLQPHAYGCSVTRFNLGIGSCEDHGTTSPAPAVEDYEAAVAAAKAAQPVGAINNTVPAVVAQRKETVVHLNQSTPDSATGSVASPQAKL